MRRVPFLAVLAVPVVLLAACGSGADEDAAPDASPTADVADDDVAAELPEGAAAVVNGTGIPSEQLEARVEVASSAPEVAEILDSEQGEAAQAQLRASILSQLIVNQIVLQGAEERGVEVDEAAVDEVRQELVTQAGGQEAFDEQVDQSGLDEVQLAAELEAVTALRLVREDLRAEAGAPAAPTGPPAEGASPDPADALLQDWLLGQLRDADVAVAPEIGDWDPARGAVVPPGGAGAPAPGTGAPAGPPPSPTAGEG